MKTVSDDLFRLIKALNKSEKGFFKKFAAKNAAGSRQNYIVLFDAIDSLESYDEELLKKNLRKQSFIKQLPVYKNYLFNLILKSLSQYSAYDTSGTRIRESLENAKTLASKGLHREALKLLDKTKQTAVKYMNFSSVLDILITERNIMMVLPDKNIYENREKIYNQLKKFTRQLELYREYSWLSDQLVIFIEQTGSFTREKTDAEIQKILSHPYMSDETKAENYLLKNYLYQSKLMYYVSQNNMRDAYLTLKKSLSHLEDNRHFIDDNPKNYFQTLINFLFAANLVREKEDVRQGLVKLNALRKRIKNKVPLSLEIYTAVHAANTEMLLYVKNCDIARGRRTAKKVEDEILQYKTEVPRQIKISLLGNTAAFHIIDGNFDAALRINNILMKDSSANFRSDVHFTAKILQLLIHYEMKNYSLLDYLVPSVYKYLKSHYAIFKCEAILIDFFKQVTKHRESEHLELFGEMSFKFGKVPQDYRYNNLMSIFDFTAWAHSKAKGIKLINYLKQSQI